MFSTQYEITEPSQGEVTFRAICQRGSVNPELIPDLVAIFKFLQEPDYIETSLDQLEQSLQQYASRLSDKSVLLTGEDGRFQLASTGRVPDKCHKILSGYFYQWGLKNGYQQKAKIIDALMPEVFLGLVSSQSIFKDSTALLNISHGMWSHTIQWYCIIEFHKMSGLLQHSPLFLYQQLGSNAPEIWNYLLDRLGSKSFHSPEYLSNHIINDIERWPLLGGTLKRQKEKLNWGLQHHGAYHRHLITKHAETVHDGVIVKPF